MIARVMLAAAMTVCVVAATSPPSPSSSASTAPPARMRVSPGVGCRVEAGHDYPSLWNATALLVCEARRMRLLSIDIDTDTAHTA